MRKEQLLLTLLAGFFLNGAVILEKKEPQIQIVSPRAESTMRNMQGILTWQADSEVTQIQMRLTPANNDGPAMDMYWGNIRNTSGNFVVGGPYITPGVARDCFLLPGTGYTWEIRGSSMDSKKLDTRKDDDWGLWSSVHFRTPPREASFIKPVSPKLGDKVESLTPLLIWENANLNRFSDTWYYEIQLSKDINFETDPQKAVAPVYWELINACDEGTPMSYLVKKEYSLEPKHFYYWRIRPRAQGDALSVDWSKTFYFETPITK